MGTTTIFMCKWKHSDDYWRLIFAIYKKNGSSCTCIHLCKLLLNVWSLISVFFHICDHGLSLLNTSSVYQTIQYLGKSALVLIFSWWSSPATSVVHLAPGNYQRGNLRGFTAWAENGLCILNCLILSLFLGQCNLSLLWSRPFHIVLLLFL